MFAISDKLANYLNKLLSDGDIETKLGYLMENEIIRRLTQYELTNKTLSRKYNMSFEQFREQNIVAKYGYSFEVESDYWDWEMALDGIETMQELLNDLRKYDDDRRIVQRD